ncbi:MAG TPA: SbcC/MukB-like Walker B domain-containing protein, partial [Acidimicrobiales bacterium]
IADAAERAARAHHAAARDHLAAMITLAERQQRFEAARVTRAELDEQADRHAADQQRRAAALRAAPVLPLLDQLTQAGARSQHLAAAVEAARQGLAHAVPSLAEADRDQLAAFDQTLLADLGHLAALTADEGRLEAREAELTDLAAEVAASRANQHLLDQERQAIPTRRAAGQAELDAARKLAARVDDLATQRQILIDRHDAAVARDARRLEVTTHRSACAAAAADELAAHQAWLERYDAQLANRAAALALALEDGRPCPVCGSAEHPAPATGDGPPVGDDEVAAAKARFDDAAARHAQVQRLLSTLEAQLAALAASAGGQAVDDLAEAVIRHQGDHRLAAEAAEAIPALEAQLADVDRRATAIDEEIAAVGQLGDALDTRRATLEGALSADRERVVLARGGFATLAERADHLQAQRTLVTELMGVLDQRTQTDDTVLAALERAEAEAVGHGFVDVTEAAAAAMGADRLAELVEAIDAHERALAETDADLRHPDLLAAAELDPADVGDAQAAAVEADLGLEVVSIAADAARKASARLERLEAEVDAQLAALVPRLETAERSRRLADLASGDDRQVEHRMRLSTYVLAARLEQVAAAASERLQRMSSGRYTIVHTDDVADGRRKGGLGLRIVDAWTSTERETSTLSGGESFFTSLALALGVADVVSAEVGGVAMETMFIDEGFGSLDDDTLQSVMDVLDGLRAGGRTIGIVSHVGDLRTRITSQLEVVKSADGSRLRATGMTGPADGRSQPSTAA